MIKQNVFDEVLAFDVHVENQNGILRVIAPNICEDFQQAKVAMPFSDQQEALDFMSSQQLFDTYDEERLRGRCTKLILTAIILDQEDQFVRQVCVRRLHHLAQMAMELGLKFDE